MKYSFCFSTQDVYHIKDILNKAWKFWVYKFIEATIKEKFDF